MNSAALLRPVQLGLLTHLPHQGPQDAQFLSQGKFLATHDYDGTLRTWNTATGSSTYSGPQAKGFAVDKAHDVVAAWDEGGQLYFLQPPDRLISTSAAPGDGPILRAQWSSKSSYLLTVSNGNAARVWDGHSRKPISPPLRHDMEIAGASFSPDETEIVTWCVDGAVRLWNIKTGQQIGTTMRHTFAGSQASVSSDGRIVMAVDGSDLTLSFSADGSPASSGLLHPDPVESFYVFSNPLRIITSTRSKDLWWWNLENGLTRGDAESHLRSVIGVTADSNGMFREAPTK